MARWPKPPEGSWTEHYPELGTEPVSYEDSISPEFYDLEREAIFKRAWLNVGRMELLPRNGSYFTKEVQVANTSVVIVRDMEGKVHAFHNICRHRGNKLVWSDFPREETSGACRQFVCKYHGWRYDLDGALAFIQQESEFFDLDKRDFGLVPVHCDVWQGFIFINFPGAGTVPDRVPGPDDHRSRRLPLRKAHREVVLPVGGGGQLEAVHGRLSGVLSRPGPPRRSSSPAYSLPWMEVGFEAPYYRIDGPHRVVSTAGIRPWEMGADKLKPMEIITDSGLQGPWEKGDLGVEKMPAGLNPAGCDPWGLDSFQLFPNFVILIWARAGTSLTTTGPRPTTATSSRGRSTSCPPRTPRTGWPTRWQRRRSRSSGCKTPTRWKRPRRCSSPVPSTGSCSTTKRCCAGTCTRRSPTGSRITSEPGLLLAAGDPRGLANSERELTML